MRALGIDVSQNRGLDLAVVDENGQLKGLWSKVAVAALPDLLGRLRPDALGIDAPSYWSPSSGGRSGERELLRRGIRLFLTPTPDRAEHPFYRWMVVGMAVYEAAEGVGYRRYPGCGAVAGHALEVFPHATAILLAKGPIAKRARRTLLASLGVALPTRVSQDGVDATLAALTVRFALQGQFEAVGSAKAGCIILPRLEN